MPQNRERVFIIASIRGRDRSKVFPIGKGNEIYNQSEKAGQVHGDKVIPLTAKGQSNWTGTFIKRDANKHDACVAIKTATKAGFELARVNRDSINLAFPDSKTRRGRVGKDKAQTLDTYCNQGIAKSDIQIRKLTPLECWRLQGWSDEDFFKAFFLNKELGIRFNRIYQKHKQNPVRLMQWAFKHQKMSDSQLYKQAGNGVTVTVIQRIGERLEKEND